MVVFTCNHCGESLKKQAVEKHYQWKACRNGGIFVSCMDCLKDFREQEYVAHTKCISEAEKYSGKDYVPKASANKGQRKQEAWSEIIQKVLERGDLSPSIRNTLNSLTNHENVPRKRPKFANFMKNISRSTSQQDVNRVFDLIEEAFKASKEMDEREKSKAATANAVETTKDSAENGKDSAVKRKSEDTAEEPSKKKKTKKTEEPEEEKVPAAENGDSSKKSKKKKKKEPVTEEEEVPVAENGDSGKKSKKKKKKSAEVANGDSTNGHENGSSADPGFCWKDTIRSIVAAKGNSMSLKKLQTKVLKAYQKETGESETVNDNTIDVVLKRKLKKMKNISIDDGRVVITV